MMKSVGQPAEDTRETRMRDECFEPPKVVEKPMSRIRQRDKQSVRFRDIKRSNGVKTVMLTPASDISDSRSCKNEDKPIQQLLRSRRDKYDYTSYNSSTDTDDET